MSRNQQYKDQSGKIFTYLGIAVQLGPDMRHYSKQNSEYLHALHTNTKEKIHVEEFYERDGGDRYTVIHIDHKRPHVILESDEEHYWACPVEEFYKTYESL